MQQEAVLQHFNIVWFCSISGMRSLKNKADKLCSDTMCHCDTIRCCCKLHISKYMSSFINNLLPCPILEIFTLAQDTHAHGTRHSKTLKLKIKKTRTVVATKSIVNMGPVIWNSISYTLYYNSDLTHLISAKTFSSRFRRAVLQEYSN